MSQPWGTIQFYESTANQWQNSLYRCGCVKFFPLFASNDRLLPFQIQRSNNDAITSFSLSYLDGTTIDLSSDISLLGTQDFDEGFNQIIYEAQEDMSTSIEDGIAYIIIEDGTNTFVSDYFTIKEIKLGLYGFGSFNESWNDSFLNEGIISDSTNERFILNWINTYDLDTKIYQDGFNDVLVVDSNHNTVLKYTGEKKEEIIDKSTGQEIIEAVYYYNEYELIFTHNIQVVKFLTKSQLLDKFTLITKEFVTIEPNYMEVEILENIDEFFSTVKVTFRTNYRKAMPSNYDFN